MQGVREQVCRAEPLRNTSRKQDVGHLALSVRRIPLELGGPKFEVGVVPANLSAPVGGDRANIDDAGGGRGSGGAEDGVFDERYEEEVAEMVGAELRLEALLGADNSSALRDGGVVDHNLRTGTRSESPKHS